MQIVLLIFSYYAISFPSYVYPAPPHIYLSAPCFPTPLPLQSSYPFLNIYLNFPYSYLLPSLSIAYPQTSPYHSNSQLTYFPSSPHPLTCRFHLTSPPFPPHTSHSTTLPHHYHYYYH